MAWLTRRSGETSTACRRTVPCEPIRVESSRGPVLTMASTRTWMGFCSVTRWMISKACCTIRTAMSFLPLFRPFIMSLYVSLVAICERARIDVRVDQSLDDRHSSLGELLLGISAGSVGDVDGVVDVDVVGERDVLDLDPGG